MKLLLISNSISYGKGYLDHCEEAIVDFLGGVSSLLFIPYASHDLDKYTDMVSKRFAKIGITVLSIHNEDPKKAISKADAFFVGGGNTFRLLKKMQELDLIEPIRKAIKKGTPYIGSSAGSNFACPTIKTTNDMPIVFPENFEALDLIPFQINPHYIDADPSSKHKGETREMRINEFHEENDAPVLGLYEGSWIIVEDNKITLEGNGAKLFLKGKDPIVCKNGKISIV